MFPLILGIVSFACGLAPVQGEEKNGLSLTVAKKTLDRADSRLGSSYYYSDRIDRTQGLKANLKNTSFKDLPEGELNWTILVRKYYSGTVYRYDGKEKVGPLKAAASVEMVIGSAQITGWKDSGSQIKDKIEYQVSVSQLGKEVIRVTSISGFDALAKRSIAATPATP